LRVVSEAYSFELRVRVLMRMTKMQETYNEPQTMQKMLQIYPKCVKM
jgi:hypothetical protein